MYNQEKYIARCLDSIVTQSMSDKLEIIVVDDGSQDSGPAIVNQYLIKYGRKFKMIAQHNKGLGGARNTGVVHAVGKYIWFVDSDDTIKANSIESLYNFVLNTEPEMVIFDMDEVNCNGELLVHAHTYDKNYNGQCFSAKEHKEVLGSIHSASNRIILREFYQNLQIDFPDRLCFEDLMTIPKILCQTERMLYVQYPFYNYYHNEGSIMRGKNIGKYKDIIEVMDNLLSFFSDRQLINAYKAELEYMLIFHAYLMVSARIIKQDYKSKILGDIRDYVNRKWPQYHKNVYIKRLNIKHKISLWCIDYGIYWPIYYALKMEGK